MTRNLKKKVGRARKRWNVHEKLRPQKRWGVHSERTHRSLQSALQRSELSTTASATKAVTNLLREGAFVTRFPKQLALVSESRLGLLFESRGEPVCMNRNLSKLACV